MSPNHIVAMFTDKGNMKEYGPVNLPCQDCTLTPDQQDVIQTKSGLLAVVDDGKECGIWDSQRAPDNAGMRWP